MKESAPETVDRTFIRNSIEAALRIGIIAGMVWWCFLIVRPFVVPALWAIIFAVALYPVFGWLNKRFGGRARLAATVLVLFGITILTIPIIQLSASTVSSAHHLALSVQEGTLTVPPPPAGVADWPVIGKQVTRIWSEASENLQTFLMNYGKLLQPAAGWLVTKAAGLWSGAIILLLAFIISGVLMVKAETAVAAATALAQRLAGENGSAMVNTAGATIRSVAQGVLGIAVMQGLLAGIGMLVVGVPGAGLWAGLVLVLAIMQLPPILVMGPVIFYVFGSTGTGTAIVFAIYGLLVSASDAILKPLFLGRGVEVPMPVILLGAIGGMILSGIVGLFLGAVVLALGYQMTVCLRNLPFRNNLCRRPIVCTDVFSIRSGGWGCFSGYRDPDQFSIENLLEFLHQLIGPERLFQEMGPRLQNTKWSQNFRAVTGNKENPEIRPFSPETIRQFSSVNSGHDDIADQKVDLLMILLCNVERILGHSCFKSVAAKAAKYSLHQSEHCLFILDQQYCCPVQIFWDAFSGRFPPGRHIPCFRATGEIDPECCALSRPGPNIDKAVVLFDDAIDGRQTKPSALPDLLGCEEGFKNLFERIPFHSAAIITDRQADVWILWAGSAAMMKPFRQETVCCHDPNLPSGGDGIPGINTEVAEKKINLYRINVDHPEVLTLFQFKNDIFSNKASKHPVCFLDGFVEIQDTWRDDLLPGEGQEFLCQLR